MREILILLPKGVGVLEIEVGQFLVRRVLLSKGFHLRHGAGENGNGNLRFGWKGKFDPHKLNRIRQEQ